MNSGPGKLNRDGGSNLRRTVHQDGRETLRGSPGSPREATEPRRNERRRQAAVWLSAPRHVPLVPAATKSFTVARKFRPAAKNDAPTATKSAS